MRSFDVVALVVSLLLFIAYRLFLAWRLSKDTFYTVHAVNNYARLKSVERVMAAEKPDVLALQTLRNSVMAASRFATTVRFFNHVGYMINIPARLGFAPVGPRRVAAYLGCAGYFYLIGTRNSFYCVPLVFWLFGPQFMLVATIILLFGVYRLDRAPTGAGDEDLPL